MTAIYHSDALREALHRTHDARARAKAGLSATAGQVDAARVAAPRARKQRETPRRVDGIRLPRWRSVGLVFHRLGGAVGRGGVLGHVVRGGIRVMKVRNVE